MIMGSSHYYCILLVNRNNHLFREELIIIEVWSGLEGSFVIERVCLEEFYGSVHPQSLISHNLF